MNKCEFPEGMNIKPDGVNELDPCIYETIGIYTNCVVEINKCKKCGHIEISWRRTENTEELEDI